MSPSDTLSKLAQVDQQHGFTHRSVRLSSATHASAAEVEDALRSWAGAAGWIARQSAVLTLAGARVAELDTTPSSGAVLECELGTASETLQLRRLGAGWVWTRLLEIPGGDMLSDDVVLVTTTQGKAARYRRYWTLPACGAAEITACRLVGLEDIA